jgi:putative addiction module CopG family antidote
MSRTYTPGPEADAIVEQLLASGHYGSADEIVRASLQLLQGSELESEADLEELRGLIAEGDAAYARGDYSANTNAEEFLADIENLGDGQSAQRLMSRTYTPGSEADAIVEELLAEGGHRSADEVVRVSLQLLQASEPGSKAELEELRRLIAEADADIAAGRVYSYTSADEFMADIVAEGKKIAEGEKLDSGKEADHLASSER